MDYELIELFKTNLHTKLKQKIVGKIYVNIIHGGDALYVQIQTYGNLAFKMYIEDFSTKILNGYSTDYAVYEVMQEFKKFLNETFFYY